MKMNKYLSGKKLYGDDFDKEEIKQWYKDEEEAYADLNGIEKGKTDYPYHELNKYYGFNKLPKNIKFQNILGFGSAHGEEFIPILDRIKTITIIEPSDSFKRKEIHGKPCKYVKPNEDGKMNFKDETFDLIISFGTLHHIPNVSYIIGEMTRCLKKDGYILIREPIVSMGDWTGKRENLTARERGIPLNIFRKIYRKNKLEIISETICMFPIKNIESKIGIKIDKMICKLMRWNLRYHPTNIIRKFRPTNGFFVLRK